MTVEPVTERFNSFFALLVERSVFCMTQTVLDPKYSDIGVELVEDFDTGGVVGTIMVICMVFLGDPKLVSLGTSVMVCFSTLCLGLVGTHSFESEIPVTAGVGVPCFVVVDTVVAVTTVVVV